MYIIELIQNAIGIHTFDTINLLHMSIRGILIYFLGVSIARSNKKIIGIRTPFNFMLFVMLGSIFANAVVDGTLFLPIIGTMFIIILLNATMKALSFNFKWIEKFIKGTPTFLIKNGKIDWNEMNNHFITKRELLNELATQVHHYNIDKVEEAILGSDGSLNFVFK